MNNESLSTEAWLEKALSLRMDAEAIIQDCVEGRTRFLWAQNLPRTDETQRAIDSEEAENRRIDEKIRSMSADINGKALATMNAEHLLDKYGRHEEIFLGLSSIADMAVEQALPLLGDYKSEDYVDMSVDVTSRVYAHIKLPWKLDEPYEYPHLRKRPNS